STIGLHSNGCKIFYPISSWIEDRFPHRSITHSLLATAVIAAVSLGVNYFFLHGSLKAAIALQLSQIYKEHHTDGECYSLWAILSLYCDRTRLVFGEKYPDNSQR
ncbi:MAG: hypothetical protein WBM86_07975, partial [Waterburya sp.]